MKRKKARFRRNSWILIPALGSLFLLAVAMNARSGDQGPGWLSEKLREPRFHLKAVEYLGLQKLAASELHQRTGLAESLPLIDLDVEAVAARVCAHPRVASCTKARIPPDRLVFEIQERVPIARLVNRKDGVDFEGMAFPLTDGEAATLTELRGNPKWALPLFRAAQSHDVLLAKVDARAAEDVRFQPAGQTVWVRVGAEPDLSLLKWRRLSGSGLLRGYAAREVDLRFEGNAVLRGFRNSGGERGDGPQ
jgi:hypothetical protein